MKKSVVIFTCQRDAALCAVAARHLIALGVIVTLCADSNDAIDKTAFPEGVTWTRSIWPRRGNLNGKHCVVGILSELKAAADRDGSDWVCKVDSDTLVSPEFFAHLDEVAEGCHAVGHDSSVSVWYGACYAIRAGCLGELVALTLGITPETPGMIAGFPEDQTVGKLLRANGCNYETRRLCWYDNKNDRTPPGRFLAYHFGYSGDMPAPFLSGDDRRAEIARRMAKFVFPGTEVPA